MTLPEITTDWTPELGFTEDNLVIIRIEVPESILALAADLYARRNADERAGSEIIGELYGGDEFLLHLNLKDDPDDGEHATVRDAMLAEGWPAILLDAFQQALDEGADYIRIHS